MSLCNVTKDSHDLTHHLMLYAADLGNIITFLEQTAAIQDEKALLEKLLQTLDKFNLTACIKRFDGASDKLTLGSATPEIEARMRQARWEARIQSEGPVMLLTWEYASMIVTDMPIHDEDRYGTLRDSLATLMNAVDAKLEQIEARETWTKGIHHIHTLLEDSVNLIDEDIHNWRHRVLGFLDDFSLDLKEAVYTMDLTDDQEAQMLGSLPDLITDMKHRSEDSSQMTEVMERLFFSVKELKHDLTDYQDFTQQEISDHDNAVELF